MTYYNNIPTDSIIRDSAQSTIQIFNNYNKQSIQIDAATYDAMVGFFGSKGFDDNASHSMAYIIIKQSKLDAINPFTLIETLKGLESIQLSNLITEIVNYNRYKSSSIGYASPFSAVNEIARNIIA
jgi:hypothetical protein